MDKVIFLHGKQYISARQASKITGYTSDYVGQLCRGKKIDAKLIGRSWYVLKEDILGHKSSNSNKKHFTGTSIPEKFSPVFPEGKKRAGKIERKIFKPVIFKSKFKFSKGKIEYIADNEPLFPVIIKKFDPNRAKYVALKSVEESLSKSKKTPFFEKFVINAAIVSFVLLSAFVFVFKKESVEKKIFFLYNSYLNVFQNEYVKFKNNLPNINQNNSQLASSLLSVDEWQFVSEWVKDAAYKIAQPWLEERNSSCPGIRADVFLSSSSTVDKNKPLVEEN